MTLETIFLAKILGLYFLVIGLAIIHNREKLSKIINLIDWHNSLLPFIVGTTSLFLGLVIVIGHNLWGNFSSLFITLIGWLFLIKAVFCLFNHHDIFYLLKKNSHISTLLFHGLLSLIFGIILVFIGFFS